MATGPRTPRTSTRPVYETFEPKSEMKEKEEAYFVHVYLPGFTKERIKINFVRSSRVVRVIGERPLGGNRISNFEHTYPVPENCEVEKLQGKYDKGILIITMPKKPISSQVSPKAQVETRKKGPTPISPLKPKEVAKEAMPPKSPIPRMEQGEKFNGDKKGPQNVQEETKLKSTFASTPKRETGKSQKGQEEIEPKPTPTMGPSTQIEDKKEEENKQNDVTSYIEKVKKKLQESVTQKEVKEDGKPHEKRKPDQKYIDHNMVLKEKEIKPRPKDVGFSTPKAPGKEKQTSTINKGKSKEEAGSATPKAPEKEKEISTIGKGKSKEDEIYTIGKGIKEVVASATEVATRIGEGKLNDEEKPLVANMGAAFLVIVALGAYVTYKLTSSSKD